jgi:hypothetical protein
MQLEGLLSRFALRELLELSIISLVTGAIEVQAPAGVHRIFFVQGRCVHASSPDAQGFEALWPLFELQDAPFRFVAGYTTPERTITESTPDIVERAESLARQWTKIRPYIPHLDIVPEMVMPANGEQVRIYEEDWPILSGVDGSRTVAEVAHHAVLDPLEACISLIRLKYRGLVKLERRRAAQPPAQAKAISAVSKPTSRLKTTSAPAQQSSFFARLLVDVPQDAFEPTPAATPVATSGAGLPQAADVAVPEPTASDPPPAADQGEYDDILRLLRAS